MIIWLFHQFSTILETCWSSLFNVGIDNYPVSDSKLNLGLFLFISWESSMYKLTFDDNTSTTML